jgi:deoxycytidylate deaminase
MCINAGIKTVIVGNDYPDELAREMFEEAGVKVEVKSCVTTPEERD